MRSRSIIALVLALLVTVFAPVMAQVDEAEYEKAARTILCDCGCHPQSTYDCACGRAAEMRDEIRDLVAGGLTGDEVVAKYVAERGEQIRIAPTATGFNLVAWMGPFFVLVIAGLVIIFVLRHWSRSRHAAPASVTVDAPAVDDPYVMRLQEKMKELE